MDLDDLLPRRKPAGALFGEDFSTLSVGELEQRIKDLEAEIARVAVELDRKRNHEAAARSIFKT